MRYPPQGSTGVNTYSGTDSNKSNLTPVAGNSYEATDTLKKYYCFTDGSWTLVDSTCVEEYSNHLGTTDNMMGFQTSTGTASTDSSNHECDLSSRTLANAYATYDTVASGFTINPSTDYFEVRFKVKNLTNGTAGTRKSFFGLLEDPTGSSADFISIYQDENDVWWIMNNIHWTHAGSGYSQITTSITDGDLIVIKGVLNNIYFLKNGSQIGSISTYISSQNLYVASSVQCSALTTVARQVSVDYIGWRVLK